MWVGYLPQSSALTFTLRGSSFGFTPAGFTAPSVTAGTLAGALDAGERGNGGRWVRRGCRCSWGRVRGMRRVRCLMRERRRGRLDFCGRMGRGRLRRRGRDLGAVGSGGGASGTAAITGGDHPDCSDHGRECGWRGDWSAHGGGGDF